MVCCFAGNGRNGRTGRIGRTAADSEAGAIAVASACFARFPATSSLGPVAGRFVSSVQRLHSLRSLSSGPVSEKNADGPI